MIGIPDERSGQVPRAYIVREGGLTENQVGFTKCDVNVNVHCEMCNHGNNVMAAVPRAYIVREESLTEKQAG